MDTYEELLRGYFGKYGDLVESVIMRDRIKGHALGFDSQSFQFCCRENGHGETHYQMDCSENPNISVIVVRFTINKVLS